MRFLDRVLVCKEMTNLQAQRKLKDEMMVRASKRVLQGEWRKQKSNEDVAFVLWRSLYCLCSGPTHSSDRPFSGPATFVEDVRLELLAKYPLASAEMSQYVDDVAMNGCRDNVWQSLCDVVGLDWRRVCTMSFGKDWKNDVAAESESEFERDPTISIDLSEKQKMKKRMKKRNPFTWRLAHIECNLHSVLSLVEIPRFNTLDEMEERLVSCLSIAESNMPHGKNDGSLIPWLKELLRLYEIWSDDDPKASFRKGVSIANRLEGFGTGWYEIGSFYHKFGKYTKALHFWERDLIEKEQNSSTATNDGAIGACYNNIALIYDSMGKYNDALQYYERSLKLKEQAYGSDHPSVAQTLMGMGNVYGKMGKYNDALQYYERSLKLAEQAYGSDHPSVAQTLMGMGNVYGKMGKYNDALQYYERSLKLAEQAYGSDHPSVATTLMNMGSVYNRMGKYNDALQYYERSLKLKEQAYGSDHPSVAETLNNMGSVYDSYGQVQ